MESDPKVPKYHTSDRTSFAYVSARDRWPVILTGAIDDIHRAVSSASDPAKISEGKKITEALAKLKYELQHDRALTPLVEDGSVDIPGYNQELQALGEKATWFNVPWLYAECYLYRRIHTSFSTSTHWRNHDIFSAQKLSTFHSSRPAVLELALQLHTLLPSATTPTLPHFLEICEISLWGNATDLSLLTTLSYADIQKLQGSAARKESEANILANDLEAAYKHLDARKGGRVDIVLDNAGFELYVDLVLAVYLSKCGLVETIVLHPKNMPWFVSDVILSDFASILQILADPDAFYNHRDGDESKPLSKEESAALQYFYEVLSELHGEGRLILRPNAFWTMGGGFWRMKSQAERLWDDLRESDLVIFKGDLNYRKLVGDVAWPATTPFKEALGPMGDKGGLNVLALRTCKADVVVGLPQGRDEELKGNDESGRREWAWSGKWAVCQLCLGRET